MDQKTYTAPAVIACTDAVRSTRSIPPFVGDGLDGQDTTPGSVGFSL